MIAAAPKVSTIVHALELVTRAHAAKLSESALGVCEKIARTEGATLADVQRAVARGLQLLIVMALQGCTFSCSSRPAQAASVTPGSDTVYAVPVGAKIPGRFYGVTNGVETWDMGDFTVRVRRVAR